MCERTHGRALFWERGEIVCVCKREDSEGWSRGPIHTPATLVRVEHPAAAQHERAERQRETKLHPHRPLVLPFYLLINIRARVAPSLQ